MSLDLLLVNHTTSQRQFSYLSFVDFLLHRSSCEESVDVARFLLTESVK